MGPLLTFPLSNRLAQLCQLGGPLLPRLIAASGAPSTPAPVVTSVTIDNTAPTVGDTITATAIGTHCDSFSYVWKADGAAISGETAATYTATRADAMGKAITCAVMGHNTGGDSSAVASDATALVTGAPVNTVTPVATTDGANAPGGPAIIGDTLSTTDGTWTGYPVPTLSYQWNNSDGAASGANAATYTTGGSDNFHNPWFCRITGTNSVSAVDTDSNTIAIIAP